MNVSHHCTISKNGLKMYFINSRRVSRHRFYEEFPSFDDELCVTSEKRRRLRESLKILKSIEKDLGDDGPLTSCKNRLLECNKKVSDLEERLTEKPTLFNTVKLENKKDLEYLQNEIILLKSELLRCVEERKNYEETIKSNEEVQRTLSNTHSKLLSDLQESRDNYNLELQKVQKLNEEIKSLTEQLEKRYDKKLEEELMKAQEALRDMTLNSQDLNQRLSEITERNKEFRKELQQLVEDKNQIDQNDESLLQEIKKQMVVLNQKIGSSDIQINILERQLTEKKLELDELRKLFSNGITDKTSADRIVQLELEISGERKNNQERLKSIDVKFMSLQQEKQKLLEENSRLLEERALLETESVKDKSKIEKYEKDISEFNSKLEMFNKSQEEFLVLKQENKKLYDAVLSILKYGDSELLTVDEVITRLKEYDTQHDKSSQILKKEREMIEKLSILQKENERLLSKLDLRFSEVTSLKTKLENLNTDHYKLKDLLDSEKKTFEKENEELRKNVSDAKKQILDLEEENQRLLTQLENIEKGDARFYDSLSEELKQKNTEIASLNTNNEELLTKIKRSNESLDECERQKEESEKMMKELQQGLISAKEARLSLEGEKKALDEAFERLQEQFSSYKPKTEAELKLLKEQKEESERFLNEKNQILQERLRMLESSEEELQAEYRMEASEMENVIQEELDRVKKEYNYEKISDEKYLSNERLEKLKEFVECELISSKYTEEYNENQKQITQKEEEKTVLSRELTNLIDSEAYKKAIEQPKQIMGGTFLSQWELKHKDLTTKIEELNDEIKELRSSEEGLRSKSTNQDAKCNGIEYYGYLDYTDNTPWKKRIEEYEYLLSIKEDCLRLVKEIETDLETLRKIRLNQLDISGQRELKKIIDEVKTRKELRQFDYEVNEQKIQEIKQLPININAVKMTAKPDEVLKKTKRLIDDVSNKYNELSDEQKQINDQKMSTITFRLMDLYVKFEILDKEVQKILDELLNSDLLNKLIISDKYYKFFKDLEERYKESKYRETWIDLLIELKNLTEEIDNLSYEEPSQTSQLSEEPSQTSQLSEEPSQASQLSEEPSQASQLSEEPSQASQLSEEPSQVEEPSQASQSLEELSQPSLRNSKILEASEETKKYLNAEKNNKEREDDNVEVNFPQYISYLEELEKKQDFKKIEDFLRQILKTDHEQCLKLVKKSNNKKAVLLRCNITKKILEDVLPPKVPSKINLMNIEQEEERDNSDGGDEFYSPISQTRSFGFKSKKEKRRRLPRRKNKN